MSLIRYLFCFTSFLVSTLVQSATQAASNDVLKIDTGQNGTLFYQKEKSTTLFIMEESSDQLGIVSVANIDSTILNPALELDTTTERYVGPHTNPSNIRYTEGTTQSTPIVIIDDSSDLATTGRPRGFESTPLVIVEDSPDDVIRTHEPDMSDSTPFLFTHDASRTIPKETPTVPPGPGLKPLISTKKTPTLVTNIFKTTKSKGPSWKPPRSTVGPNTKPPKSRTTPLFIIEDSTDRFIKTTYPKEPDLITIRPIIKPPGPSSTKGSSIKRPKLKTTPLFIIEDSTDRFIKTTYPKEPDLITIRPIIKPPGPSSTKGSSIKRPKLKTTPQFIIEDSTDRFIKTTYPKEPDLITLRPIIKPPGPSSTERPSIKRPKLKTTPQFIIEDSTDRFIKTTNPKWLSSRPVVPSGHLTTKIRSTKRPNLRTTPQFVKEDTTDRFIKTSNPKRPSSRPVRPPGHLTTKRQTTKRPNLKTTPQFVKEDSTDHFIKTTNPKRPSSKPVRPPGHLTTKRQSTNRPNLRTTNPKEPGSITQKPIKTTKPKGASVKTPGPIIGPSKRPSTKRFKRKTTPFLIKHSSTKPTKPSRPGLIPQHTTNPSVLPFSDLVREYGSRRSPLSPVAHLDRVPIVPEMIRAAEEPVEKLIIPFRTMFRPAIAAIH